MSDRSHELDCVASRFETLRVRITLLFYALALGDLAVGTVALVLHGAGVSKAIALSLEGVAVFVAGVVAFVPLDSARKSCATAARVAAAYRRRPHAMSREELTILLEANTLCFAHPLTTCPALQATAGAV